MICRLCLDVAPTEADSVHIFDDGNETLAKLIEQQLQLRLLDNDPVSTRLCRSCWRQLRGFEEFRIMVQQQQRALQLKLEPLDSVWQTPPLAKGDGDGEFDDDDKSQILAEPEIAVATDDSNESIDAIDASSSAPPPRKRSLRLAKNQSKVKSKTRTKSESKPGTRSALNREMDELISASTRLECDLCNAPLDNFTELKRHFSAEHQCVGYVLCCQQRYKRRWLYVDHLRMHMDPSHFQCKICGRQLVSRASYDTHMLRFHAKEDKLDFACSQCSRRFAKQYILAMHMRSHKKEHSEQCGQCSRTFRTRCLLRLHVSRNHDPSFVPFICDTCGAHFKTKQNFDVHKRAVHGEGPQLPQVQCSICASWLRDENSLRKHMYQHRDAASSQEFRCGQCDAVKESRIKLAGHIRYHHPKQYHKCSLCPKVFKQSRALDEHMATHTGIDLYACPFCSRTFKNSGNMHKHKKNIHAEQMEQQKQKRLHSSKLSTAMGENNNNNNEIND